MVVPLSCDGLSCALKLWKWGEELLRFAQACAMTEKGALSKDVWYSYSTPERTGMECSETRAVVGKAKKKTHDFPNSPVFIFITCRVGWMVNSLYTNRINERRNAYQTRCRR